MTHAISSWAARVFALATLSVFVVGCVNRIGEGLGGADSSTTDGFATGSDGALTTMSATSHSSSEATTGIDTGADFGDSGTTEATIGGTETSAEPPESSSGDMSSDGGSTTDENPCAGPMPPFCDRVPGCVFDPFSSSCVPEGGASTGAASTGAECEGLDVVACTLADGCMYDALTDSCVPG